MIVAYAALVLIVIINMIILLSVLKRLHLIENDFASMVERIDVFRKAVVELVNNHMEDK